MIKEDEKVEEKVKLSDYLSFCLDFEKIETEKKQRRI